MSNPSAVRFFCRAKRDLPEQGQASTDSSPFFEHRQGGEELPRVASAFVAMSAEEQGHWNFDAGHLSVEFLRFLLERHQESLQQLPPEVQALLLSPTNHGLRVVSEARDLDAEIYEVHVSDTDPQGVTLFHLELDEEGKRRRVEWSG